MRSIVYNVPLSALGAYRGRHLIVRSAQPEALVEGLGADDFENLAYVQLCSLPDDTSCLIHWLEELAIDLVVRDPLADFARLYRYAKLLDNHPVRASVPVAAGFDKAVKLALSLELAVKLELGQPDTHLIEALAAVLDAYLHQSTVSQPIEPFHSLLLAFLRDESASLWAIQEEDPAILRYVDELGVERLPGKLAAATSEVDSSDFVERWVNTLIAGGAECADCPFLAHCRGYFKWPQCDYVCAGVKSLFQTLHQAAGDLQRDLAAVPSNEDRAGHDR